MKRLIDEVEAVDAGDEQLAYLVKSAEKFQANPFRKRWVLSRIRAGKERRGLRLRPWVVIGASLLVVGSATAGGAAWVRARRDAAHLTSALAAPPSVRAEPIGGKAELLGTSESAERQAMPDMTPTPRPTSDRSAANGAVAKSTGEDPATMVQAIRALRKEHDPARAESLLQDYLRSHPRGALTEDALALLIETAAARHDPAVTERAARYIRLYPDGRYRAAAERALGSRP
jgi:hypothetical protein